MALTGRDNRTWSSTDRPGERLTIARILPDLEIASIRGSHRHWCEAHENMTLALVHRGQDGLGAEWRTRGRSVVSVSGSIMAIECGEVHVTKRLTLPKGGADFDVVHFSPAVVARAASELGEASNFHFKAPAVTDPEVFDTLGTLVNAVAAGDDSLEIECAFAHALQSVVSSLGENPTPSGKVLDPVRDYRLREVRNYLRTHLDRRPTLSELEAVSGLSQWRLCALFKRAYGVSIGRYWNAFRLDEAVRRLQRGVPIAVLVGELGYADESYFWRIFKRHYGVAPGGWLNIYRANDWTRRRD